MNSSKKINVNYSSLVGLKAELLRKQTEVKDAKVNAEVEPIQGKHKVKNKKPKVKKLKIEKELIDTDDIKAHKKSRLMLEAKARLYDNLKKTHNNKHEHFLVDFENKSESEEERYYSDDYEDANSDPEEDWVEYEDCFGRTRKCLRRDLSKMQQKDDFVKEEVMKKPQTEEEIRYKEPEPIKIIPKEPEIEMMRRKWEEQTEKLADKMNIHYQDVLFDEARAHGVGYYEFSHDEEVRAKQQLNLDALRKETLQKQKEMQNLKEMKEKMELNRLKAARIRQRIRAGLPPEPTEEEVADIAKTERVADPEPTTEEDKPEEKTVAEYKEKNSLVEIENKIKAFGELLGKRTEWREMSQEEWIHKRRKVRDNEFAPVYNEFRSAGYLEARKDEEEHLKATTSIDDSSDPDTKKINEDDRNGATPAEAESSDSNDTDVIGPMPPTTEPIGVETFTSLPESIRTELSSIDFSKPPPNMRVDTAPPIFEQYIPIPVPPPIPTYHPVGYNLPIPQTQLYTESDQNAEKNESSSLNACDSRTAQPELDESNITAGLRFLRANFEQHKNS